MSDKQRSSYPVIDKRYMLTPKGELYAEWLHLKDAVRRSGSTGAARMLGKIADYFECSDGGDDEEFSDLMYEVVSLDNREEPEVPSER